MLWILIAAAVCAGDLLVKHYIDTHKEENCHEPWSRAYYHHAFS